MMRVDLHDEELRVVHLRRIGRARDADRARHERQAVVLARDLVPTGSGPGRVTSLDNPVLDAVKREPVIEADQSLLSEPGDELRIVVERGVLAARDAERAGLEGEIVVFAGHALAAGAGAFWVTALHHPILDAMECEAVVETAAGFCDEALDGLRCLVRTQRE